MTTTDDRSIHPPPAAQLLVLLLLCFRFLEQLEIGDGGRRLLPEGA
jgi:hypothetical protein